MSKKKPRPWTEKHKLETLRRIYELAAELVAAGTAPTRVEHLMTFAVFCTASESRFRDFLANAQIPADRHSREVRRVRARAESRVVTKVKTTWIVYGANGASCPFIDGTPETEVRAFAAQRQGRHVVRVTTTKRRIRRAVTTTKEP